LNNGLLSGLLPWRPWQWQGRRHQSGKVAALVGRYVADEGFDKLVLALDVESARSCSALGAARRLATA
jgi:hypothetical protein